MSENIASSTWLGARPSLSQTSSYSSAVSPSAIASLSKGSVSDKAHRAEDQEAVVGTGQGVDRVLGVRHEAEDVAGLVADAGDVLHRAVVVVGVAEHDLVGDRVEVGGVVAAGRVLDRDRQLLARPRLARERRLGVDDLEVDLPADEAQL